MAAQTGMASRLVKQWPNMANAIKKITVVGRGTVGAISAAQLLSETDAEIEWLFDSTIPTAAVGEGTTLMVPKMLSRALDWDTSDLYDIGGTAKLGIWKENWGSGNKFLHPFPVGSHGMHMCATDLQKKIFEQLAGNKRLTIRDEYVSDPHDVDSDGVLVCSGSPENMKDFDTLESVAVNACYVTQCYWDGPKFSHTLTIARPYGWVFGIPLQNRCSIGYLFNKDINELDHVIADVQEVFAQFGLQPSDETNFIKFRSYRRKDNFQGKVVYNGNSSFFVEPLEATSTSSTIYLTNMAGHYWRSPKSFYQERYDTMISDVAKMIALHYIKGSIFDTKFWDHAKAISADYLRKELTRGDNFYNMVYGCLNGRLSGGEVGTWSGSSFRVNIKKLGIREALTDLMPSHEGKAA